MAVTLSCSCNEAVDAKLLAFYLGKDSHNTVEPKKEVNINSENILT